MALNLVALGVALQNQGGGSGGGSYSSFDNAAGGQTYKIKVGQELVMTDLVATENGVYDKPVIIGEPVFEVGEKLVFKPNIVLDVDFPKTIFDDFGPYVFFFDGQYRNPEGGKLRYDECILRRAINQSTGEVVGFFIMLTVIAENCDFLGYSGMGSYVYFDAYTAGLNALEPGWYKNDDDTYTKLDTPPYLMLGEETSFGAPNHEYNPALLAIKGAFEGKSIPADGWHTVTVDLDASGGLCSTVENEAGGLTYNVKVGDVGEEANPLEALFDDTSTEIEEINLPNVTALRSYAFYKNNDTIRKINAPNLKTIGEQALCDCPNLALTSLPSGITSIGMYAFSNCSKLALTSLPSGLTTLNNYAFNMCLKLALTSLPSGITKIPNFAFGNCSNLALTSLPSGLKTIGQQGFGNCQKLALTEIPSSVTSIGYYAFTNCTGLQSIVFKGTPTTIDGTAFSGCNNLTTINVPWAEGEVANAPWGAPNATINYNYTEEG